MSTTAGNSRACRVCPNVAVNACAMFEEGGYKSALACKLTEITDIEIEYGDGLSESICLVCAVQIEDCYAFKRRSEQWDKSLRSSELLADSCKLQPVSTQKAQELCCARDKQTAAWSAETYSSVEVPAFNEQHSNHDESSTDTYNTEQDSESISGHSFINNILEAADDDTSDESTYSAEFDKTSQTSRETKSPSVVSLTESAKNISMHQCVYCGRKFRNDNALKQHHRTHLKCSTCKGILDDISQLHEHLTKVHQMLYNCVTCKRCYLTKRQLNAHNVNHATEQPCKICGKVFGSIAMKNHMREHRFVREQHICPYCSREFKYDSKLQKHMKAMYCVREAFTCKQCKKNCVTKDELRQHLAFHQEQMRQARLAKNTKSCEYCGKTYSRSYRRKVHQRKCIMAPEFDRSLLDDECMTNVQLNFEEDFSLMESAENRKITELFEALISG